MKQKRLIAALTGISIVFFAGCAGDKATKDALKNAEVLMEECPEESLEILETIDREMLTSRKETAKFALLYSMALDKNYIDLQSDSIISPAVKYYRHHGKAREKLQSLYYLGRIYYNAGDIEEAMRQYVEAERYVTNTDNKIAGRLYKAKAIAYQDIYDFNSALEQAQFAADRFYAARDTVRYINTLIDIAVIYCLLAKYEDADNCLRILKSKFDILNERQISNYYAILLNSSLINSPDSVPSILSEYLTTVTNDSLINWLYVSEAYSYLGDYSAASASLDKYIFNGGLKDAAYYWTSATLLEKIGDLSSAIEAYKRYLEITDDDDLSIFYADTKFIEERYDSAKRIEQKNYILIILSLSAVILILSLCLLSGKIKQIKEERRLSEEKYLKIYDEALDEIERLKETLEDNKLTPAVQQRISERLNLLNTFIVSNMTPNYSKSALEQLKQLMDDKDYFIESTRLSFLVEHPKFISYLQQYGLTDNEIGYCCLYAMGLKGKDISSYLGKGHYKQSSAIRKKLGLNEHDTNLDIYIRDLISKESSL